MWIGQKRLKLYGSPIPLLYAGKLHPDTLTGFRLSSDVKQGRGGKPKPFSDFKRQYIDRRHLHSYY